MNPLIHLKTTSPLLITLTLLCFALLPKAQAVVPPPDGGYPNFTTAEGQNALFSLTTGAANTAVGWFSLKSVTTGSFNTGLGAGTLVLNTGDSNTATGVAALLLNTDGHDNTANGTATLVHNSTGSSNTAVGAFALNNNDSGNANTALGRDALFQNTTGTGNTATGHGALTSNIDADGNTANGFFALHDNTAGEQNTAIGQQALAVNQADANTATGFQALFSNTTGNGNTAIGVNALTANAGGDANTAIGVNALQANSTGSANIGLGFFAGAGVSTANNVICIGALGQNVDSSCYISHIFNQPGGSQAVFVSADGKLGAQVSSRGFKEEIKPMDEASEALFALQPVKFRYKKEIDPDRIPQFGLVAEDVEEVNPDLVIRDNEGKPYSVRYDQVNAMLLNEFLKEHRKVQELEANAARQQKQIEALTAGLQRVSAQLELSKPVPQTVLNSQ
jgi:Chaperone of endosialidase